MPKSPEQLKQLSIKEFTEAAQIYESGHAGIYEICKDDYPHPEKFFSEAARVLRPGGHLILRDYTSNDFVVRLMNNIELPLARLMGHGDVRISKVSELRALAVNCAPVLGRANKRPMPRVGTGSGTPPGSVPSV